MILRETKPRRRGAQQLAWPSTLPGHWAGNAAMGTLDRRMSSMLGTYTAAPEPPPPPSSVRTRRPLAVGVTKHRRRQTTA